MVSSTLFLLPCLAAGSWAFQVPSTFTIASRSSVATRAKTYDHSDVDNVNAPTTAATELMPRRTVIATTISSLLATAAVIPAAVAAEDTTFLQTYDDFTATSEGWSYTDKKIGTDIGGGDLKDGDRVVFDWSGYTIGYFGRPFEAKGGPQGGAFDKSLDYFRTTLGSKSLIPGLECALRDMKPGGIRQVIIPYGPLSYPPEDKEHESVGPKPTTFSGMRALNFVLENPRVDRTLLFNVKLIRVDRSDGKGGFIRG